MINIRIFPPLLNDHPIIGRKCIICDKPFFAGQRLVLVPIETGKRTVEAEPTHATCHLFGKGVNTPKGDAIITRIKDGDASPYPVETNLGQFKEEECYE